MESTKKVPAKKVAKKVAKKAVAKKVAEPKKITRANFPDKGWGLSPKAHDQVAKVGIEKGYSNLSQVIRAALHKAFGIDVE